MAWAWSTRRSSSEGRFIYRRGGRDHMISFNGRNRQFHAVYEDMFRQGYEPETSRLITRLLPHLRGAFFDVGSNWGYYAMLAASAPEYSGAIHAFEPSPRVYGDLESMLRQAELTQRITTHAAGVGAHSGELVIEETDPFHTGLTRLVPTGSGARVPVQRLDDCGLPAPDLIKIDAEGMEHAVISGARQTISASRPYIIFESFLDLENPEATQLPFDLLREQGYRFFVPTLIFQRGERLSLAAFADNVSALLAGSSEVRSGLAEIGPLSRFLSKGHINVFAAHASRVSALWQTGIVDLDNLFAKERSRSA